MFFNGVFSLMSWNSFPLIVFCVVVVWNDVTWATGNGKLLYLFVDSIKKACYFVLSLLTVKSEMFALSCDSPSSRRSESDHYCSTFLNLKTTWATERDTRIQKILHIWESATLFHALFALLNDYCLWIKGKYDDQEWANFRETKRRRVEDDDQREI